MTARLAKSHSEEHQTSEVYIHETEKERAFYRFECGHLVEFDLTKTGGKPVRLTKEEAETAEEFIDECLANL